MTVLCQGIGDVLGVLGGDTSAWPTPPSPVLKEKNSCQQLDGGRRVGLWISRWPDGAPRGAVSTFCAEHGVSRKMFYALRYRGHEEGPAVVLESRLRRPKASLTRIGDEVTGHAVEVLVAVECSGLDYGPIMMFSFDEPHPLHRPSDTPGVHDKMKGPGRPGVLVFHTRISTAASPRAWVSSATSSSSCCSRLDGPSYP